MKTIVSDSERFELTDAGLRLQVRHVPWDSEIFGFPVAAIHGIEVCDNGQADAAFADYERWLQDQSIQLVSCRLPHDQIATSMLLERRGFRFVEMVLHPVLRNLQSLADIDNGLSVETVLQTELSLVVAMAERAFGYERYHADPRVDSRMADLRYGRWVRNSFADRRQTLLKVVREGEIAGFFVIENRQDGTVYWHLTALAPELKGQGIGTAVWRAMLSYHRRAGMDRIATTISARNTPVLNLYSKLNFRFEPPEITLHWLRSDQ